MFEMINACMARFAANIMAWCSASLNFILCAMVIVLGLILVIRFARTWLQRGLIAGGAVALIAAAPYITRYLLIPFFGTLLQSVLTVSVYCIIGAGPLLLLAGWIWKTFTRHL